MAPNRCPSLSNPHWLTHPMHACKPPAVQWVAPPAKNQPKAVLSTPEGLVLAMWLRGWNYVQDYRKSIFKYTRASCQSSLSTFCKPCHPRFFSLLCASTGQAPPEQQSASALVVHDFILCSSCAHPATVDPRWSKDSCWSSCPGATESEQPWEVMLLTWPQRQRSGSGHREATSKEVGLECALMQFVSGFSSS